MTNPASKVFITGNSSKERNVLATKMEHLSIDIVASVNIASLADKNLQRSKFNTLVAFLETEDWPIFHIFMKNLLHTDARKIIIVSSSIDERKFTELNSALLKFNVIKNPGDALPLTDDFYKQIVSRIGAASNEDKVLDIKNFKQTSFAVTKPDSFAKSVLKNVDSGIKKNIDNLVSFGVYPPKYLAIAASTGGPKAILTVLADMKTKLKNTAVFITIHMPPSHIVDFAQNIEQITKTKCLVASDGTLITNGTIYIAPGDFHLVFKKEGTAVYCELSKEPPVHYCRPAADPMLSSLAKTYGPSLVALVLTGMGKDGLEGAKEVAKNLGNVIVQDEATSVVWGMPGIIAKEGIASAILPLNKIGAFLSGEYRP